MTTLARGHCVACEAGTPPMDIDQAHEMMVQLPGWDLKEPEGQSQSAPRLVRTYRFKDFTEAMIFVNRMADLAETEGHHPDMHISGNRVRVELTTHAIKGLSDNDFIMAAKISEMGG